MAEKVWMVHLHTFELCLMYAVDAREAVRRGDYAYAPVGGYDPPRPPRDKIEQPREFRSVSAPDLTVPTDDAMCERWAWCIQCGSRGGVSTS